MDNYTKEALVEMIDELGNGDTVFLQRDKEGRWVVITASTDSGMVSVGRGANLAEAIFSEE